MFYVPDPYDEFVRHEAEIDRRGKHRPKCHLCHSPITGDEAYEIAGEIYCPDCIEEQKFWIYEEDW